MALHLGETQIPIPEISDIPDHLPGLPRACPKCGTWDRYKKPEKVKQCFSVACGFCGFEFEVVKGMKGSRKI